MDTVHTALNATGRSAVFAADSGTFVVVVGQTLNIAIQLLCLSTQKMPELQCARNHCF